MKTYEEFVAELETYANIWVTPDEDNSITSLQALDKMDALAAATQQLKSVAGFTLRTKHPPDAWVWSRNNTGGVYQRLCGGVLTNQGWRYDSWLGFPLFEDASYWRPLSAGVPAEDCKGMER